MIIFLSGSSSYLAIKQIQQIREKYLSKNDSSELQEINPETVSANWADLLAVPLFASSRLIIIRRAGEFAQADQENLASVLPNVPSTTVVVIWDSQPLTSKLTETLESLKVKKVTLKEPAGAALVKLIEQKATELGGEISPEDARKIIANNGSDLWAIDSAVFAYVASGTHLVYQQNEQLVDSFKLMRACQNSNFAEAAKALFEEHRAGKPIEMLIGSMAAGVRKARIGLTEKLSVVELLSDIDLALKSGLIEDTQAVALLQIELPKTSSNRLQWEEVYDEIYA